MVTVPIDALRPSSLTLTEEEIADIKIQIAQGVLPANYLALCEEARTKNVFGFDYKRDKQGNPIEQGIGSPGNESKNHYEATKKAELRGELLPGTYDKEIAALAKRDPDKAKRFGLFR